MSFALVPNCLYGAVFLCAQICRWEFLVFSGTFETRLTVHEAREHGEVVFNLISSSFMQQFQGAWKVCLGFMSLMCHVHGLVM